MDPILIAALVLGGLYLFSRSGGSILPSQNIPMRQAPIMPPYTLQPDSVSRPVTTLAGNIAAKVASAAGPGAIAAGTTISAPAAGTAAGAAGGATLLGMPLSVAIPVIGGLAALTTWGVISQGWFRGGWEGVKGNTLRDKFLQQFVDSYFPGAGSERQYDAIVRAFIDGDSRARQMGLGGIMDGNEANRLISQLYAADSEDEMRKAMRDIVSVFGRIGITVLSPL